MVDKVLQAHREGSSLRGISRTTKLAYNSVRKVFKAFEASGKDELLTVDKFGFLTIFSLSKLQTNQPHLGNSIVLREVLTNSVLQES